MCTMKKVLFKVIFLVFLGFVQPQDSRIVGGSIADPGQFPWQVSVREGPLDTFLGHTCGGIVINENWVLTAAHCCQVLPTLYHIVAGDRDRFTSDDSEQHREVRSRLVHEDYDDSTYENDLCLLQLEMPLIFDDFVDRVELPEPFMELQNGTMLTTSGYGKRGEQAGYNSDFLIYVDLPYVQNDECTRLYEDAIGAPPIVDSFLCAGDTVNGGKDFCSGDAGGPVVLYNTNVLVGVTSWGSGCGRPEFPGVSMKVSHFTDWISNNIQSAF